MFKINNLKNRLIFIGCEEDIEDIMNYIARRKDDESENLIGTIDFNNIIPMTHEEDIDEPEQQIQWMILNWNTDTNAICPDNPLQDSNEIVFLTNTTAPFPVIEKLSAKFPDIEIILKVSDIEETNISEFRYSWGCCIEIVINGYKVIDEVYIP